MPDSDTSPDRYSVSDRARLASEEPTTSGRSAFARDRARVLHSAALRRLAAKTQVVVAGQLDFPRTRLTHTLEVAQIAREVGAALGCDPDLVEVAGLAHDLGHPPFGHNGETALHEVAAPIGGFEGNAQSLRVLTRLEAKSIDPATGHSVGLNLTRAALDAATKYPWPLQPGRRKFGVYADDLPVFTWFRSESPGESTCLEAQVMDWADDVAYSVHDVEDAVHAGHVDLRVFTSADERAAVIALASRHYAQGVDPQTLSAALDRLRALDVWMSAYDGSMRDLAALKRLTSQLIGRFCAAAEHATRDQWGDGSLTRYAATLVVPDEVRHEVAVMKAVAAHYVMNRDGAERVYTDQRALVLGLVAALVDGEGRDLDSWLRDAYAQAADDGERLRVVIDQVASLTDVSVVSWARRLGA